MHASVPLSTTVLRPRQGTALDPLAEEMSIGALRLAGANPDAISNLGDLVAASRGFAQLLEVGAIPGRSFACVDIHAPGADRPLAVHLLLGYCGPIGSTSAEARAFVIAAQQVLTAYPGAYRVEAADPLPVLAVPRSLEVALICQRTVTVADGLDVVSVLSRFDREADHWQSLIGTLYEAAPIRFRTSLLATELDVADYLDLRVSLEAVGRIVSQAEDDPELSLRARRASATLRDIVESYRSPLFVAEVALASPVAIPETLLVRAVAAGITREFDVIRVGETPTVAARERLVGGFIIERNPPRHSEAFALGLPFYGGLVPRRFSDLVSATEAACAFQFPIPAGAALPTISTHTARPLRAPGDLPAEGAFIGRAYGGQSILLPDEARLSHEHLLGVTGCGKSTAILAQIQSDLRRGVGFALIDPHGPMADNALEAASRLGISCLVFDPSSAGTARLAVFEGVTAKGRKKPELIERSIARILEAVISLWPAEYSGPQFISAARTALTLIAYNGRGLGLGDVGRVLSDSEFARELLQREGTGLPEWVEGFLETFHNQREKADFARYVASKFDDVGMRSGIGRVLAPVGEGILLGEPLAANRPIIIKLSKGYLSALDMRFLGHLFLSNFIDVAFERPEGQRTLFSVYVDEAHNFPAGNLERGLNEGRKWGLSLVLAHQHLSQLREAMRDAVLGSCAVRLHFRLAPPDAHYFASDLGVSPRDLMGQPDLHAYMRYAPKGRVAPTFTVELPSVPEILSGGEP